MFIRHDNEPKKPQQCSNTVQRAKALPVNLSPQTDGRVPEWNTYYPSLSEATTAQREFYGSWKKHLEAGDFLDIKGNLSYIFIYLYGVLQQFIKSKRIHPLLTAFQKVRDGYGDNEKIRDYLFFWTGEAYLFLRKYDQAWPFIVQSSIDLDKVFNFRSKCKDTSLDGPALLAILKSRKGLTKFGQQYEVQVAELATILLSDFQSQHGSNIVEHFCREYDFANLSEEDLRRLSHFYSNEKDFLIWKDIYQHDEQSKYPYKYHHGLFAGAPLSETPGIECKAIPYVIMVAIENELKRILRECENTIREEMNLPKVGEGWVSESYLFHQVHQAFPREHVVHHGRPAWLSPQHLDVYLPKRNIGIEYQGLQHEVPAKYFGGEEAFKKQQKRDRRKKRLCTRNGCRLIYVYDDYDFQEVKSIIQSLLSEKENDQRRPEGRSKWTLPAFLARK